jgi:RNA polymerase sigma factor (sigma-70 family)
LTATTTHLLGRARKGDDKALELLCRRYIPRLERWAAGRLPASARDLMDTSDLVQETVVASICRIDSFEQRFRGSFQAYLRRAVLNRIRNEIDRVKRRPRKAELDGLAADSQPSPIEDLIGAETLERYERALEQISADDRELVIARVEMCFSYREIALFLGKPSSDAARMAVGRALMRLAEAMGTRR